MKKILTVLILVMSVTILNAQNNNDSINIRPLNGINLNLLGDASWFSINYERLFSISPSFIITGKIGLGYNREFAPYYAASKYFTIPHHITGNLGKGRHLFEFGLGGTIINENSDHYLDYIFYPIIGYRFLPLKSNHINFRLFSNIPYWAFSGRELGYIIFIPFGLSIGISF
jgi:hypothetical protein